VTVSEVDLVGSPYVTGGARSSPRATLTSHRVVDGYLVQRFRLAQPWTGTPAQIGTRAASLSGSPSASPAVLIQQAA
jgi:hypothetical protein